MIDRVHNSYSIRYHSGTEMLGKQGITRDRSLNKYRIVYVHWFSLYRRIWACDNAHEWIQRPVKLTVQGLRNYVCICLIKTWSKATEPLLSGYLISKWSWCSYVYVIDVATKFKYNNISVLHDMLTRY